MSNNNNKNKPASTITKLIDYFNDDEEEEEEDEEIYQSKNNNISSLGASGKISHLYSYRDENAIEEDKDENNEIDNINNENNNINNEKPNENKIFTTLYPNEQPDSSFCCEEHPKGDKFNNGTEFIGRAVSFHRKKGESNENNNLINEEDKNKISYVEDNKEISKISKENTFTNTGLYYIDNLVSFSKDKINMTNNENNIESNNNININNTKLNNNSIDNDKIINEEKDDSKNIDININNNQNNIENENDIDDNKNDSLNNKNVINPEQKTNLIKTENNQIVPLNINNNSNISNYNIIYNNEKTDQIENKDVDSMINITNTNDYLMDYDEKTLEDEENEFLELEKQRKEKEKIKKKKEELLEQLRIKQEEKKALEKKLEEKKLKDLNNKNKKLNENINDDNNKYSQTQIKIKEQDIRDNNINNYNQITEQKEDEKINEIENDNNQIIYSVINSLNDNINSKNMESNKENELINSNNYQKFDSFKNINNLINNNEKNIGKNEQIENIPKSNIYESLDKKLFDPEYLIDSSTFDAIQNGKNSLHYNSKKNSIIKNNKIEESKKDISDKENKNIKILKNIVNLNLNTEKESKTKKISDKKDKYLNEYNTYKNPIELTLYNDALKRRKKLENIDKTVMKGIKLNSNKTKITNASYKVAIEHDEKIIEKIINRYSNLNKKNNTKYINIIGIALSLRDMKIFRELYKKDKYNLNNNKNIYPLLTLKKIILSVDKKETRKIKEINFLQQTWLLLNKDEDKDYINKDIFLGLLKIIFSPEGTIREIEDLLNKYLEAVLVGINLFNSKKNNNNIININNNKKDVSTKDILLSPIDNKRISYQNLWPLSKYLKKFFELKKNLIAYKTTDNMKNLNKEKYRDMVSKHQKIKSNIINSNYILENPNPQILTKKLKNEKVDSNFDKLYQKFLEKEQYRKIVLEEMRKKKEMDELKELKEKPTISKFKDNTITEKDFALFGKKKENIHDRLYKMDKDIKAKKQELIEEKEKLEQEKLKKEQRKNKLKLNSRLSKLRMNKSFDNPQKCKGFDEFVRRNRKGYLERLRVKYLLEKSSQGERYEEIMRRNITPPNITDIRRMREKGIKSNNNEINSNENESDEKEEYFNLQIKLPNGKMQTLKIYENDDANEVVEEFCKIHSIDDNVKNKLVANIQICQKQFLLNDNKNNENEDYIKNDEEVDEEQNNILLYEN